MQSPTHQIIAVAQVGRSLASIRQIQMILAFVLSVGGVCAVILVYFGSFWLTSRELRPLHQLISTMSSLSTKGLGVHMQSTKQAVEMQLLVEAFNQMSDRLEAGFTLQRNFVAAVSHELRTPLTSLRGQMEVLSTAMIPSMFNEKNDEEDREWAKISIRDTGQGIASTDLPHIFDRHYRAPQAKSRSKLGAGLGLAIARLIAQAHGGEITVESELTKGSCFSVWLPICHPMLSSNKKRVLK